MTKNIDIKQLLDGETPFYPQTDIHGLVNNGDYAIDDIPTIDSSNLVTSGGVASELALGAVYDVTAHNGSAQFALLQALLTDPNLNTLIPTNIRRGGMSIKFVSDNKYVQFRLMKNTWSTTVSDWQGVDDEPTADSDNLVKSSGIKSSKVVDIEYIGTEYINLEFLSNFSDGELFITSDGPNPANVYKLYVRAEDSELGYEQVPFKHDCIYLLPNGEGYTCDETEVNNKPKHAIGSIVTYEDGQGLTAAQQDNARKNIGFVVLTESEYEALVDSQQIDPNIIYMTTEEE